MVQNITASLSDWSFIRSVCLQEQMCFELSFKRNQGTGSLKLKGQGIPESWRCHAKASIAIPSIRPGCVTWRSILLVDHRWQQKWFYVFLVAARYIPPKHDWNTCWCKTMQTLKHQHQCLIDNALPDGKSVQVLRIGLMWSRHPAQTVILAAAFCTFCSREMRQSSSSSSSALAKVQAWDYTRARTSFWAASSVMKEQMVDIVCRCQSAAWQTWITCCSIDIPLLNTTPMCLALGEEVTSHSPSLKTVIPWLDWRGGVVTTATVLSSFILR